MTCTKRSVQVDGRSEQDLEKDILLWRCHTFEWDSNLISQSDLEKDTFEWDPISSANRISRSLTFALSSARSLRAPLFVWRVRDDDVLEVLVWNFNVQYLPVYTAVLCSTVRIHTRLYCTVSVHYLQDLLLLLLLMHIYCTYSMLPVD